MMEKAQHQDAPTENGVRQMGDPSDLSVAQNRSLHPATDSASDNEASERPVREKLKKTSIASIPKSGINSLRNDSSMEPDTILPYQHTEDNTSRNQDAVQAGAESRGRSQRKRSFEDLEAQEDTSSDRPLKEQSGHHSRKRSRDIGVGDDMEEHERLKAPGHIPVLEENEDEVNVAGKEMSGSRDQNAEEATQDLSRSSLQDNNDQEMRDSALSPRKKRSRDQLDSETHREQKIPATEEAKAHRRSEESEREGIAYNGSIADHAKAQPAQEQQLNSLSHNANDLYESPTTQAKENSSHFSSNITGKEKLPPPPKASFATSDPASQQTRASATTFASSGFASLSGSLTSPFGTLGAKGPVTGGSPFTSLGTSDEKDCGDKGLGDRESKVTANGAFASTAPSTPTDSVGARSLGFGTVGVSSLGSLGASAFGSGFGSAFGAAPKLTSFAAPTGDAKWAGSAGEIKQFGAPAHDTEEEEVSGSDDGGGSNNVEESDETGGRFQQQGVETGEDGEETLFSAPRAALFRFDGASWKEGGRGTFKLNATAQSPDNAAEAQRNGRFIMRAHQTYRVLLNEPIYKEMLVGDAKGNEPKSRSFAFAVFEKGKAVPHMIRISDEAESKALYREVRKLQQGNLE